MDIANKENDSGDVMDMKSDVETQPKKEMMCAWEYEIKMGNWVRYEGQVCEKLNDAQDTDLVEFDVEESKLAVDISELRQTNMVTGFKRNVRFVVQHDEAFVTWEWQKGRRYYAMPRSAVLTLESLNNAGDCSGTVLIGNTRYKADLDNFTITAEDENENGVHKIRRVESKAESSFTTAPAPMAEKTRSLTKRSSRSVQVKKEEPDEDDEAANTEDDDVKPSPVKKPRGRAAKKDGATSSKAASPPPVKSTGRGRAGIKSASGVSKSARRVVTVKGRAAVDVECVDMIEIAHVFDEGHTVWDAMLNQTNIANNNNKYYLLQLLEEDSKKEYSVWFRWGRVGYSGQTKLEKFGCDLQRAKNCFEKKFLDKTRNDWSDRNNFENVPGKYTLIHMDYAAEGNSTEVIKEEEEEEEDEKPLESSKLDKRVRSLLGLICNLRTMEETVMQLEYDSEKAPLGKLTVEQIRNGLACLSRIEQYIKLSRFGREFTDAVNEYYTKIPHNFGFKVPPLIKTEEQLKKEMDLLEVLEDIEIAVHKLTQKREKGDRRATVDIHYEGMQCAIAPLDAISDEYQLVSEFLASTHGATHMYKMKLLNVFSIERNGEKDKFEQNIGNRKLLWHGSRLSNWYGILSQGLRIAPPEAPTTGYMFGKGIYFADVSSKSGNYCYPTKGRSGLLVLAEVALGEVNELYQADYDASSLPSGKQSVKGVGRMQPSPDGDRVMDGMTIPCGEPKENGKVANKSALIYNEYIVYNTNQVRLRYLVEVEFDM